MPVTQSHVCSVLALMYCLEHKAQSWRPGTGEHVLQPHKHTQPSGLSLETTISGVRLLHSPHVYPQV